MTRRRPNAPHCQAAIVSDVQRRPTYFEPGAASAEPATFYGCHEVYHADTCAPLRAAAACGDLQLWAYGRGTYPGEPIPEGVLAQLPSVGLWDVDHAQGWGLDWHRNEGIEIGCITRGYLSFSCEESEYELGPGAVTITRPWQPHRIGRPHVSASRLCWFIIDVGVRRPNQPWSWPSWLLLPPTELVRVTELLRANEHPVWQASGPLTHAVERLQYALRGQVSQPLARIGLCIAEIFIEVADILEKQIPAQDPYLKSTARVVEMFLARLATELDKQWTLGAMAEACGLKKTSFVHYCRQLFNASPTEYLRKLRVARSVELLETTDQSITDVAMACGFQSSQYFANVFKMEMGLTPSAQREQARAGHHLV